MAYTQAKQVAALVQRHVLPGVVVSIGQPTGQPGIEVVIRGYQHPEDGMSRLWIIDLLGSSGDMLDLAILGLRKAGFDMRGSAPMMRGVLTQMLDRVEIAAMRAKEREIERKKEKAEFKAELQAETLLASRVASNEVEELRDEITRLKEMIEDLALMPQPRGPQGAAGRDGRDGIDGNVIDLGEAKLSDLGDVLDATPSERQVLTWKDNKWQGLYVPTMSGDITGGGGGSGGGGSISVQMRDGQGGAESGLVTSVSMLSFDTTSGFGVVDQGNGEVHIELNSTFAPWHVAGQTTLDPTGEEPVEFVGGPGVTITTDANASPKQIIFETSGDGNLPEAPQDGRYYVRQNGVWIDLQTALKHLMVGDGGLFSPEADGGDFVTGTASTLTDQNFDGGDFDTGTWDGDNDQMVDGMEIGTDPYFGTTTGPDNYQ